MRLPEPRPYANNPTIQKWLTHLNNLAETHPPDERWAPWPTKITTNTASSYTSRINHHHYLGAGYEATVRNKTLYVRRTP